MKLNAAITAVGGWVPEEKITNHDLEKMVDTNDEWIISRTGIKERRILRKKGAGTSEMASRAVADMCQKIGLSAQEIDVLICATATPDMGFVATANIVCETIGAKNALSFDMSVACSGFIYALETAANFVRSGRYAKVVVVGADKMSAVINYKDRRNCILFGDGAACVLLEPNTQGEGLQDAILKTDGGGKDHLHVKLGGSAYPVTSENLHSDGRYFFQEGRVVYRQAVTKMVEATSELMQRNGLEKQEIDWFVPHQANLRIIDAVSMRLGIDKKKVTQNIEKYGNTTSATVPLCLWEWEQKFKKGDKLLLSAFGGGFTWGALYLKWAYDTPGN